MWLTSGFLQVEFDSKQRCSTKLIHIFKLLVCRDPILFCGGKLKTSHHCSERDSEKSKSQTTKKITTNDWFSPTKDRSFPPHSELRHKALSFLVGWFSSFWLQKICRFTKLHTFTARDPIVFGVGSTQTRRYAEG